MSKSKEIVHKIALEHVHYAPETGEFDWKKPRQGRRPGVFGRVTNMGYGQVCLDGAMVGLHRLAWFMVHGDWPKGQIDHINGDRMDNRITNLRDVSASLNQQNQRSAHIKNKTGLFGAHSTNYGGYTSRIWVGGKRVYLGSFRTKEEAHEAYMRAKRHLHEGCVI